MLANLYNGNVYLWNYADGVRMMLLCMAGHGPRLARCLVAAVAAGARAMKRLTADPSSVLGRCTHHHVHARCTPHGCVQTLVKSFEVTELPVRAAKFCARKQWVITGSDDMFIRVYNYNTMDKVKTFEAHTDYIRSASTPPHKQGSITPG